MLIYLIDGNIKWNNMNNVPRDICDIEYMFIGK